MNNYQISTEAVAALEESLRTKTVAYEQAEIQGASQTELNLLYREIKDLRHQIALLQPILRKAVG